MRNFAEKMSIVSLTKMFVLKSTSTSFRNLLVQVNCLVVWSLLLWFGAGFWVQIVWWLFWSDVDLVYGSKTHWIVYFSVTNLVGLYSRIHDLLYCPAYFWENSGVIFYHLARMWPWVKIRYFTCEPIFQPGSAAWIILMHLSNKTAYLINK